MAKAFVMLKATAQFPADVPEAPPTQGQDDDAELLAGVRQSVVRPRRMIAIELAPDEAVFFEFFETIGKNIGRHPRQSLLQILETHSARKQVPDYEKCPARADNIQRPSNRTSFIKTVFRHRSIPRTSILFKHSQYSGNWN
ncbi:protein of unknown function [Bradyrhizobium vignae]|uniref:Uncharacterized protein n=1 Tax=Bradyrhizobium vignae TaxID=1549949 RepID=A0A2U3PV18_9BRAD|nr:protein of unknown function [Bradyrhizobium vignae]